MYGAHLCASKISHVFFVFFICMFHYVYNNTLLFSLHHSLCGVDHLIAFEANLILFCIASTSSFLSFVYPARGYLASHVSLFDAGVLPSVHRDAGVLPSVHPFLLREIID